MAFAGSTIGGCGSAWCWHCPTAARAAATPVPQSAVADFYRGKTISLVAANWIYSAASKDGTVWPAAGGMESLRCASRRRYQYSMVAWGGTSWIQVVPRALSRTRLPAVSQKKVRLPKSALVQVPCMTVPSSK